MIIVDCLADLHGNFPELPGGDLLIVAGDLHEPGDSLRFMRWLINQEYRKIVYIAGNHDTGITKLEPSELHDDRIEYLCDSGTEFTYFDERFPKEDEGFLPSGKRTLKIWGSPWTKTFPGMNPHCMAFTCDTEEELAKHFAKIPDDTDILITHGPPYGARDRIKSNNSFGFHCVGSKWLQMRSLNLNLKLWVVGHIHEDYGIEPPGGILGGLDCTLVNASHVNERYEPVNKPIRVIL